MPELTVRRSADAAVANARENQPSISSSITDLTVLCEADVVFILSAGPSLHQQDPAAELLAYRNSATTVAVDSALGYCLRNGLIPDFVVSLDPHPTRVCRWFGDPDLASRADDDYFRRQELDPQLRSHDLERNEKLIALVDQYGPKIRAVLGTSVSPNVAQRCFQAGMQVSWFNPFLDEVDTSGSLTRQLHRLNGLPAMTTGGNVGTAAWVFAHQVLRCKTAILLGMDFGYAPDSSPENTQYFEELQELFGEHATDAFIDVLNPYTGEVWFTDPTYYWYRRCFLEMCQRVPCRTINCSEGGTLFGEGVDFRSLSDVLATLAR